MTSSRFQCIPIVIHKEPFGIIISQRWLNCIACFLSHYFHSTASPSFLPFFILTFLLSLKPGKVVIVLRGKYAGKKAVITKVNEGPVKGTKFGHAYIAGVAKYPLPVCSRLASLYYFYFFSYNFLYGFF